MILGSCGSRGGKEAGGAVQSQCLQVEILSSASPLGLHTSSSTSAAPSPGMLAKMLAYKLAGAAEPPAAAQGAWRRMAPVLPVLPPVHRRLSGRGCWQR